MFMSRLNSSIWHNLPRNSLINSLDCMKSLHSQAPTPSPYDSQTVSALYTQFSKSQCWNQQLRIWFPIMFNPHPHQSLSMTNQNFKSPKSSTPRLATDIVPASIVSCPLDRVWGHWRRNFLDPHLQLGHASILVADFHSAYPAKPGPISSLWLKAYFSFEVLIEVFTHFTSQPVLFTILLSHSRIILILTSSQTPIWKILFRYPFCSLKSSLIPTKAGGDSLSPSPCPTPFQLCIWPYLYLDLLLGPWPLSSWLILPFPVGNSNPGDCADHLLGCTVVTGLLPNPFWWPHAVLCMLLTPVIDLVPIGLGLFPLLQTSVPVSLPEKIGTHLFALVCERHCKIKAETVELPWQMVKFGKKIQKWGAGEYKPGGDSEKEHLEFPMAFTSASTSSPSTSTTVLITDDTFLGFEPEVDSIAQAVTEAMEQLHWVMEEKQEEDLQWWLEKSWEEQISERDSVVRFVDKKAAVAVTKAVMVEIWKRWLKVSVGSWYLEVDLFSRSWKIGWL